MVARLTTRKNAEETDHVRILWTPNADSNDGRWLAQRHGRDRHRRDFGPSRFTHYL